MLTLQGEGGIRKNEGTGLGLALSQRLAQLFGGSITVHSELANGSTFAFTFPYTLASLNLPLSAQSRVIVVDPNWSQQTVLVVDDRESNRRLLATALNALGIAVSTASNGAEAIEAVKTNRPCAVLMDLQMPGMSGEETTAALRQTTEGRELAIIAVSATAPPLTGDGHAPRLFDAFLQKPIELESLFHLLEVHAQIPFLRCDEVEPRSADQGRPAAREALKSLSPNERAAFKSSLDALDYDRLSEFVDAHASLSPTAKLGLQELVENFDYNGLQVLLGDTETHD